MTIKIIPNDKGNPPGKLADVELYFTEGELEGLKLIGFAIWEHRTGGGRNVTFPARQYSVNGERRSFALLRPAPAIILCVPAPSQSHLRSHTELERRVRSTREIDRAGGPIGRWGKGFPPILGAGGRRPHRS
jgi:hypothetical protein